MEKLKLSENGESFIKNFKACLNWLAIGGDVKTESGHTIVMGEEGQPGFLVTTNKVCHGKVYGDEEVIMNMGSDTVWLYLVLYSKRMTEYDRISMQANTALNVKV